MAIFLTASFCTSRESLAFKNPLVTLPPAFSTCSIQAPIMGKAFISFSDTSVHIFSSFTASMVSGFH